MKSFTLKYICALEDIIKVKCQQSYPKSRILRILNVYEADTRHFSRLGIHYICVRQFKTLNIWATFKTKGNTQRVDADLIRMSLSSSVEQSSFIIVYVSSHQNFRFKSNNFIGITTSQWTQRFPCLNFVMQIFANLGYAVLWEKEDKENPESWLMELANRATANFIKINLLISKKMHSENTFVKICEVGITLPLV